MRMAEHVGDMMTDDRALHRVARPPGQRDDFGLDIARSSPAGATR